ncbi:MAG: hypothetical protein JSS82_08890 [Bacteroidetes bacterium]|nr:hypothetical protein [Bacteroidota bacterium]
MPGYDDPGYGCDNDLNNYNHDGSSVLNDSGSDDSGSSGFSWGDLLSSGSNSNSGNSYARSGNPYQPYMPQTNYTNAFTPQGNNTGYSSYGNNANFQKPTKPTPPKQAQNPNNPGKPVLNNHVTNNNNTTDRDVLDTGNLLGKNPLKKNVVSSDVLDARTKTFFERLQNEPLSYFPQYHPDDDIFTYDYVPDPDPQRVDDDLPIEEMKLRYRVSVPIFDMNKFLARPNTINELKDKFSPTGEYGRLKCNLYIGNEVLYNEVDGSRVPVNVRDPAVTLAYTTIFVKLNNSDSYVDIMNLTPDQARNVQEYRITVKFDPKNKDYELVALFSHEMVHVIKLAELLKTFKGGGMTLSQLKETISKLAREQLDLRQNTNIHHDIGENSGFYNRLLIEHVNYLRQNLQALESYPSRFVSSRGARTQVNPITGAIYYSDPYTVVPNFYNSAVYFIRTDIGLYNIEHIIPNDFPLYIQYDGSKTKIFRVLKLE